MERTIASAAKMALVWACARGSPQELHTSEVPANHPRHSLAIYIVQSIEMRIVVRILMAEVYANIIG